MPILKVSELQQMRADMQDTVYDCLTDIQRDTASGTDPLGNPLPPSWSALYNGLICRFWVPTERERVDAETEGLVIGDAQMVLPRDTGVTEQDRILQVRDLEGNVIGGVHNILSVIITDVELELTLEAVNA